MRGGGCEWLFRLEQPISAITDVGEGSSLPPWAIREDGSSHSPSLTSLGDRWQFKVMAYFYATLREVPPCRYVCMPYVGKGLKAERSRNSLQKESTVRVKDRSFSKTMLRNHHHCYNVSAKCPRTPFIGFHPYLGKLKRDVLFEHAMGNC